MSLDLSRIPTPHNQALKEDLADVMIMPGDPMRSKYIAQDFLTDARLVNDIRGIQGYTGFYKGKKVSVMASGIGIPAISVYAYELYNFYDTDTIIRVGTAGSIDPEVHVGDVLISDIAYTNSDFYKHLKMPMDYIARPDEDLLKKSIEVAKNKGVSYHVAPVLTEELYYAQESDGYIELWQEKGVAAIEMEAAALFAHADQAGKKALSVFTVSNNILTGEEMEISKRERYLTEMIEVVLETAI